MTASPSLVRSVVSIATGLESLAKAAPSVQEDLFGGPLQLAPTPYGDYYAELARRMCVQAYAGTFRQPRQGRGRKSGRSLDPVVTRVQRGTP